MAEDIKPEVKQYMSRCVHYTGLIEDTCKAGHHYQKEFNPADLPGIIKMIPCLTRYGSKAVCADCKFPSQDEAEAMSSECEARVDKMLLARGAIVAVAGLWQPGIGNKGVVTCPVCMTGTLSYTRAGINGHIHAKCNTEGCVSWME